ncbi:MAG: EF-Tu/IF-2/RF-3 family GTPase, partial [Christensenellaceae bacterium]
SGENVEQVLEAIVDKLPPPKGDINKPLKALVFDSFYDNYKGAISYVRVMDGCISEGTHIKFMAGNKSFETTEVGVFLPQLMPIKQLNAGDVGYVAASIKNVGDTRVGDTITDEQNPAKEALPGYKKITPMVYCGIYPADGAKYDDLRDALERLHLNDASLLYDPEVSVALGFGFRCGFLGLLHMEIIQERLEREFDLDLVTTAPSVAYHVILTNGDKTVIENPTNLPDASVIDYMEEPIASVNIMTPDTYVGTVMDLC